MGSRRIHALLTGSIASLAVFAAVAAQGDQPAFVPPAGWLASKPPAHMLGLWVHPGDVDFQQKMLLGAQRTQLSAEQFDQQALDSLRQLNGFRLGSDESTVTCGRPAHYMSYAATVNGREVLSEQMSTINAGVAWVVIYSRLMTQPSLPEARAALTTLCGLRPPQSAPRPAIAPPPQQGTPQPSEPVATSPPPSPYATL